MSEVFYFNANRELQKLELYNVASSEFVKRTRQSGFKFLCILEQGEVAYATPEFNEAEKEISNLLSGILC
jgi:hypothetical protein